MHSRPRIEGAQPNLYDEPLAEVRASQPAQRLALTWISILLGVYTLHWASAVFIPMLMSVLCSYALTPAVDRFEQWHLPRSLGAMLSVAITVAGMSGAAIALKPQLDSLIETLPVAAQKVEQLMRDATSGSSSSVDKMQQAADRLEQVAAAAMKNGPEASRGVTRVQIEQPAIDVRAYFLVGTRRVAEFAIQISVICLLTFFLLAAGDSFRRKLARIAGPALDRRRLTVQALDEIRDQIRRYLMVQLLASSAVGLATGLAFWALGLGNAAAWGVVAALMTLVPYVGAALVVVASALLALLQFESVEMMLLVGSIALGIRVISGYLLMPWLTSRMSRLNTVAVFAGVLAWGWLWGAWGLLLGAPILMIIKSVCDRTEGLRAIGELLGSEESADHLAIQARRP